MALIDLVSSGGVSVVVALHLLVLNKIALLLHRFCQVKIHVNTLLVFDPSGTVLLLGNFESDRAGHVGQPILKDVQNWRLARGVRIYLPYLPNLLLNLYLTQTHAATLFPLQLFTVPFVEHFPPISYPAWSGEIHEGAVLEDKVCVDEFNHPYLLSPVAKKS